MSSNLCRQNNASVEWVSGHILPTNALNFTKFHLQPSRFEQFSWGETNGPPLTEVGERKRKGRGRGMERIKGFLPLKEWEEMQWRKEGREARGEDRQGQQDVAWIVQCFTSPPTQYRLYGRRFLQVKRRNQQYQSTEGDS